MNARRMFKYMRGLARAHPHLAVALLCDHDGLKIGILNIIPTSEDWYQNPVKVSELVIPVLKDPAWSVRIPSAAENGSTGDVAQWQSRGLISARASAEKTK